MANGNENNRNSYEGGMEGQATSGAPLERLAEMDGDLNNQVIPTISEQLPAEVQNGETNSIERIKRCQRLGASGSGFFVKRLI